MSGRVGHIVDCTCCSLKSGLCLCQGHTPYVLLPTKDLCGGDLVQEAGDSFAIIMAQGLPQRKLCQTILWLHRDLECFRERSSSPSFLGVTFVPSTVDSPSWLRLTPYFLPHTHLPVKSLDVQAFLGRVHHKMFYGKKEFRAEWLMSLWGCFFSFHLFLLVGG